MSARRIWLQCISALTVACVLALPAVTDAWESTPGGFFIFDIDSDADMREVGTRSGIQIKDDLPLTLGMQECRRWARAYHVRPYRAIVSGRLKDRPDRVWICAGPADNDELSQLYCEQMHMRYVGHDHSKVTCRAAERA